MDVGTASAVNLYQYQATSKSSGQSAAVIQALGQAYSDTSASAGTDPLSKVLTAASAAPMVTAMYSLANADAAASGNAPATADAVQGLGTYGGLSTASAATLFTSGSAASGGDAGFAAALTSGSTLAVAAYQASLKATPAPAPAQTNASSLNLLG